MSFQIKATGRALPRHVLTNDYLSTILETSDEWITTRTGIKSRYVLTDETLSQLAAQAARQALERVGIAPQELDLILCSTVCGDYRTPSLACLVQRDIGAVCPAMDLNAACSGFLYALDTADAYFRAGKARHILVVSAEAMSKQVDWTDRSTCVLFGDGAAAVVLEAGEGLLAMRLTAAGDDRLLSIPASEGNSPFSTHENQPSFLHMAGGEVMRFAVHAICRDVAAVLQQAGVEPQEIRMFIPHQANLRIIRSAQDRLGFAPEQIALAMDHYGNTSSASIPLLLDELIEQGRVARGDLLLLSAFGGGLTTGACVIRL